MATKTTNYNLYLPVVGGDDDQWGSYINTNTTTIDTKLKELNDAIADQDLEELGNVVNTTPAEDQVLQFNGQNWSASTLAIADISGLQTALDNKADDSDLTGITTNPADGSVSYAKLNTALQVQVDRILLTDDDASPTDNQILKYSATDSEWKYADLPGSTVQTLSDVNTAALADDAVMVYNATAGEFQFESGATLRTTLGVDVSGTDNSTPVTITNQGSGTGEYDYLTLSGQAITLQQINLTTDVTDTLPVASGGTGSATASDARTALQVQPGVHTQAYDAGLQSISGLTTAADKMLYTTASDTYAVADLTAFARTILDDADAATVRTTLGLDSAATTPSSDYATAAQGALADSATQPGDNATTLNVSATDKLLGRSTAGAGSVEEITLTSAGRAILDDADAAAQRTTLGLGTAALSASGDFEASGSVSTHAALTSSVHGISSFGATLVDDDDASAARTTLGLGTISTQASDSVSITGGSVTGITDLAIADGGTGASTASVARGNLLPNYTGNGSKVLALNSGGTDVEWVTQSQVFTAGVANAFEHPNSVTDSFTVSSSDHRFYVGPVSFTNTVTLAGKMLVFDGLYNTTGTINITGTLHVRS